MKLPTETDQRSLGKAFPGMELPLLAADKGKKRKPVGSPWFLNWHNLKEHEFGKHSL